MKVALHRPNLSLWIALLTLAVAPAGAEVGPAIEPVTPLPQPMPLAEGPALDAVELAEVDEFDALFEEELEQGGDYATSDPFEGANRAFLKFNRSLDRFLFDPLTRGYRYVVPDVARRGIRRIFENANSPSILVNDLLQLRFKDAGETLGRFVLNTSLGLGGIFDVALEAGWERHEADFGQTLARMGVGSGPYLVLPVLGPNTVRDGFGDIVDVLFQPLTYLIGPTQNIWIGTGSGFTKMEANSRALRALEESSVDYYAALRSAYLQSRAAHVRAASNGAN